MKNQIVKVYRLIHFYEVVKIKSISIDSQIRIIIVVTSNICQDQTLFKGEGNNKTEMDILK